MRISGHLNNRTPKYVNFPEEHMNTIFSLFELGDLEISLVTAAVTVATMIIVVVTKVLARVMVIAMAWVVIVIGTVAIVQYM